MNVSIIICCYNSEKRLPITLKYIARLNKKNVSCELIIINNNSTDLTTTVAREECEKRIVPDIEYFIIDQPKSGLMNARKQGVANSRGEIIVFCDDDNWLEENYLVHAHAIMSDKPMVGACGGSVDAVFEVHPPNWFKSVQNSFAVGEQLKNCGQVPDSHGYLWGAGLVIRRSAWNSIFENDFETLLIGREGNVLSAGEDTEICFLLRIKGWQLWYDDSLKLKHFIPQSRLQLPHLKKMYRGFGKSQALLSGYFYKFDKRRIKPIWYAELLRVGKLLWNYKRFFFFKNDFFDLDYLKFESLLGRFTELIKLRGKYQSLLLRFSQKKV